MMRALLIGQTPDCQLGYTYVRDGAYDAVVIGSLTLSQALHFSEEAVLQALSEGKPVLAYMPGLPSAGRSRGLQGALNAAYREMKIWGILFISNDRKKLITAQDARDLLALGRLPPTDAMLTPLAREILEGKV